MSVSRSFCVAGRVSRASVKRLLSRMVRSTGEGQLNMARGLEMLEGRVLLSAATWTGLAENSNWGTAGNWAGGSGIGGLPAAGDVVSIGAGFGTISITNGTTDLAGLSSASPLSLTGGSLSSGTPAALSANLTLNGGTVSHTTLSFTGGAKLIALNNSNNLLDGATIEGTLDLSQINFATVNVTENLTMGSSPDTPAQPGQILIGDAAGNYHGELDFTGISAQTLATEPGESVQVIFGSRTSQSNAINNNTQYTSGTTVYNNTVTIAAGVSIGGQNGLFGGYSAVPANDPGGSFINQGTIDANGGGTINVIEPIENQGTLAVENSSTLVVYAATGNLGTISAITDPSTLTLATGSYTIDQPINVSGGGTLKLLAVGNNASTISVNGGNLYLIFDGSSVNGGTINVTNSNTYLSASVVGGSFTYNELGTFNRSGGTVNIQDGYILDNTGQTLALNDTTGTITLNGGTIRGGTISESGSGQLLFTTAMDSTLDGVTIQGNLNLTPTTTSTVTVNITDGLTMDAAPDTGLSPQIVLSSAKLNFTGAIAQTVAPVAGQTLEIDYTSTTSSIYNNIYDGTTQTGAAVTLATGTTIDGTVGGGLHGLTADDIFINQGTIVANHISIYSDAAIENQGSIIAENAGSLNLVMTGDLGSLTITDTGTVVALSGIYNNNVGLTVPAGASLALNGAWTNPSSIAVNGGTLTLGGTFSNTGTITATNATTNLSGTSFTVADLGSFTRSGGTVNLSGTLTNTGGTLALDSTTGPWNLVGGQIIGGTITESGTGQLYVMVGSPQPNLLDGVTIYGNLDASHAVSAGTTVRDGLTMGPSPDSPTQAPVILLNGIGYNQLAFVGSSQTIAPVAGQTLEIRFGQNSAKKSSISNQTTSGSGHGATVTLAPGVIVDGKYGWLSGTYSDDLFINQGTIDASVYGGLITTLTATVQNQGLFRASQGTLQIQPKNLVSGTLTGGSYEADSSGSLVLGGYVTTNAAALTINGPSALISSDGAHSVLNNWTSSAAGGSLTLTGGANANIIAPGGGTLTNDGTINVNAGSTLAVTGVYTQNADGSLAVQLGSNTSYGKVTATGAVTLDGSVQSSFASGYDPGSAVTFPVVTGSTLAQSANYTPSTTPSGRQTILRFNTTTAIVAVLPLAPTVPAMTAATDLGISQTDGITNDNTPGFSGTALDAGTVELFSGNTLIGTASISSGSWVVNTTGSLADGTYQVSAAVLDTAGDLGPASAAQTIVIDTAAPTINAIINAPDAGTGWYNIASGPAVVQYTASDNAGGSGLASATPANYTFADGANQSLAAVTISDIAGNSATSQAFSGINQDTVAPTISASINAPAGTGWYNIATGPAVVSYNASDSGSGLASAVPGSYTFADGANQSLAAASISDVAGNSASSQAFSGINQDTVAPNISADINSPDAGTGWYNIASGPAVVSYNASDSGSGLASAVPGNYTFADGSNQSLAVATISDIAGNAASSASFSGINQDTVAPTINATINPPDAGTGWYNIATGAAVVNYSASDAGSGLASAVPGAYTFADGANQSLAAASISDVAGNIASSQAFGGINQDTVAPTISASINAPAGTGWYNIATGPAVVSYSASDNAGGSGLASAVPGAYTFSDGANQSLAAASISDVAGNSAASQSFSGINQDTIAPSISANINSADAGTGWYNIATGPAIVTYSASDSGSGLASAVPGNYTFADGANQSLAAATISDIAGNSAASQAFADINQDTVAPTFSANINAPANTGWYNIATGPAVVSYNASDGGSGLATTIPGNFVFSDGANQSLAAATISDVAGNSAASQSFTDINQDTVAPTINATINSPDAGTGWYNIATGAAVVTYTASDNGSGLASAAPGAYTFADGANQSLAGVGIGDIAGNTATSASFSGINQDTVAPTISASINAPAGTGWYNIATGPAIVSYSASDSGSGLATAVPGNYTFADGANQSLAAATISDVAGNSAASQSFSGINQDTVAPSISASINAPAGTGWYNIATGPAIVSYSASDSGSGLASAVPGNYTFADGANQSLAAATISDVAGNSAASQSFSGINQDTVVPSISASINAPAGTGWYNIATGPAIVSYSASDSGSGLASVVPGNYTFADGANQSLVAATISDVAGNSASSQAFSGINQDTVAPNITIQRQTPANTNGWNNTDVTVVYSAADATSGVDAGNSDPTSVTVSSEGANQSVTFNAVDLAGNSASATLGAINIDKTPPTLSASVDRSPDASTGWYNQSTGAPVVSFAAGDSLSGIDTAASDNIDPVTAPEGANVSISRTVYDLAGNSAVAGVSGLQVDLTPPATPAAPTLQSLVNDVPTFSGTADPGTTVNLYADSPTNIIATTVADSNGNYTVTATSALSQGGHSITATATDQAGNISDLSPETIVQVQSQTASVVQTSVQWGSVGNAELFMVGNLLLPAGRNLDLPWIGINRIQITLSQSATITAADVQVQGIHIADYGPVTISGSGSVYTITLAKKINYADSVTLTVGNQQVTTFTGQINVLPGDVTDDGSVNSADVSPVLLTWLKMPGTHPTVWQDINGDGRTDLPDVFDTLISLGEHLPLA